MAEPNSPHADRREPTGAGGPSGGCAHCPASLDAYVADELDLDRAEAVAEHLRECQSCAGAAVSLRLRRRRGQAAAPVSEASPTAATSRAPASGAEEAQPEPSTVTVAHLRRLVRPGDNEALHYSVRGIIGRRAFGRRASHTGEPRREPRSRPRTKRTTARTAIEGRRALLGLGATSLATVLVLLGVLLGNQIRGRGAHRSGTASTSVTGIQRGVAASRPTVTATADHVTTPVGPSQVPHIRIAVGHHRPFAVVAGHHARITGRLSMGGTGLSGARLLEVAYVAGRPPRILGSARTGKAGRFQARIPVFTREWVVLVAGHVQSNLLGLRPRAASSPRTRPPHRRNH